MTAATLYIAIDCPDPGAAHTMLANFTAAGLNPSHPTVHVAIGDPREDHSMTEPSPNDATTETATPEPVDNSLTHCKECREGKHGACDGSMYNEALDVVEACGCASYDWGNEHTNGGGR